MLSRLLTKKEQFVLTGLALAIVAGAGVLYLHQRSMASVNPESASIIEKPHAANVSSIPQPQEPISKEPIPPSPPLPQDDNAAPPPRAEEDKPPAPGMSEEPEPLTVSVRGAVLRPGVYVLDQDKRVQDLIDKAGGLRENADLADINLAAWLIDGTTLTIPETPSPAGSRDRPIVLGRPSAPRAPNPAAYTLSGWQPGGAGAPSSANTQPASGSSRTGQSGNIDLNRATAEQLQSLPGIGPKLAEQIVQYRAAAPFRSVDDLLNVSGIGPKRLEAVRPFVCVEGTE